MSPKAKAAQWLKQGLYTLEDVEGTEEVLRIEVGKRFLLLPLLKQEEITTTVCGLMYEQFQVDTCPVTRNHIGLGRVDAGTDGAEVVWETWYLNEQARRDFARQK